MSEATGRAAEGRGEVSLGLINVSSLAGLSVRFHGKRDDGTPGSLVDISAIGGLSDYCLSINVQCEGRIVIRGHDPT